MPIRDRTTPAGDGENDENDETDENDDNDKNDERKAWCVLFGIVCAHMRLMSKGK